MKNLILKSKLALAVLAFTLITSCSSDDDKGEQITIVETWNLTSSTSENTYDFNGDGTATNNLIEEINCLSDITLIFRSDGAGTQELKEYSSIAYNSVTDEYTVNCLSASQVGLDELRELTWIQNNNTRLFTVDGDGFSYTGTVSGNQLSVTIQEGLFIPDENDDVHIQESITLVYTLQ